MLFDALHSILDTATASGVSCSCGTKRAITRAAALSVVTLLLLVGRSQSEEVKVNLAGGIEPHEFQAVTVELDVTGSLKIPTTGKETSTVPLKVRGDLVYDEQRAPCDDETKTRGIRYYQKAEASIRVGEQVTPSKLGDERRLIAVYCEGATCTLACPHGPLSRDELDLLDVQGNTLGLAGLLPDREVKVGESWELSSEALCQLLGLEAINQSDVRGTLRKVAARDATIEMAGTIDGAVGAVATTIKLRGTYRFDLEDRRIRQLTAQIEEKRAPGVAEPGFEVEAKLAITISPRASSDHLTPEALETVASEQEGDQTPLVFIADRAHFEMLHDRRWRVISDRSDLTILRLVDHGDMVAQCNVSRLSSLAAGKRVPLATFQSDVERALSKNFGQVAGTNEEHIEGSQILTVVAGGTSNDVPITWHYYHVTDSEGRRAVFVFTMEAKMAERFGGADQMLIRTLRMADDAKASQTKAGPTARVEGETNSKR